MTKKEVPENANKFSCERCDFQCSKESNYNRHLMTRKHKIRTNTNKKVPKNAEQYHCNCGKMLLGFLFIVFQCQHEFHFELFMILQRRNSVKT